MRQKAVIFFVNPAPTPKIYTLSLHDALPISSTNAAAAPCETATPFGVPVEPEVKMIQASSAGPGRPGRPSGVRDRKSTRLKSSHANISYAVFCLIKKKKYRPRAAAVIKCTDG